jgi:hypothetical protein
MLASDFTWLDIIKPAFESYGKKLWTRALGRETPRVSEE